MKKKRKTKKQKNKNNQLDFGPEKDMKKKVRRQLEIIFNRQS